MRETVCAVCTEPFDGQPAYLTQGARWARRRWWAAKLAICRGCHTDRRGYWNQDHKTLPVYWTDLVGRGKEMPPTPCVACGLLVVRNADPGLKRVTCSQSCSTSLTRSRNGNQGSGSGCETCGKPITTGRADSRYCSGRCRQKAYRQRKAADQLAPAPAPHVEVRSGRRPRRSQSESLRRSIPYLTGLTEGLATVGRLDDSISAEQAEQWSQDLDKNIEVIEGLAAKLEAHVAQNPHAQP